MNSALNGPLLLHYILKKLLKILKVYQSNSMMKINTTRMGLGFFQQSKRWISQVKYIPCISVNKLFNSKKGIYTTWRLELNSKCSKQANLLMVTEGGNRHYTTIKNLTIRLKFLNVTHKGIYNFCKNYITLSKISKQCQQQLGTLSDEVLIVTSRSRCLARKRNDLNFTILVSV